VKRKSETATVQKTPVKLPVQFGDVGTLRQKSKISEEAAIHGEHEY
jgi:hypothetical protein